MVINEQVERGGVEEISNKQGGGRDEGGVGGCVEKGVGSRR